MGLLDMVFLPNTGSDVLRSSQGRFFSFYVSWLEKGLIILKMKETRTENSRRSVQVSRRNVCSGPIW